MAAEVDRRSKEESERKEEERRTCDAFTEKLARLINKGDVNTILSEQDAM